ncbi:hypothetical protein PPACK8108_LOCUS360 [Phakopsora pachyrhizi]|uniref:Uncharacterized protein n=1 Tax=Phakopsora pachyrhizi TaxID=170000 RepID=A0AAV0AEL0_PHAPC|nr:hypothetical protein PPACK8108_LOCUS360 [Phakopsora pachyrhizi]
MPKFKLHFMEEELLEMNKVLRKDRSRSVMLLRDFKDYLQDTIRVIPQTKIISQLDNDKDEEEKEGVDSQTGGSSDEAEAMRRELKRKAYQLQYGNNKNQNGKNLQARTTNTPGLESYRYYQEMSRVVEAQQKRSAPSDGGASDESRKVWWKEDGVDGGIGQYCDSSNSIELSSDSRGVIFEGCQSYLKLLTEQVKVWGYLWRYGYGQWGMEMRLLAQSAGLGQKLAQSGDWCTAEMPLWTDLFLRVMEDGCDGESKAAAVQQQRTVEDSVS